MFKNYRLRKFSIRKLSIGATSVLIGLSFLGADAAVFAEESNQSKAIAYKYVVDSELTDEEKARIITALPSNKVDRYETYYMVYRLNENGSLPNTGSQMTSNLGLVVGAGLLVVGLTVSKKSKKYIVSSLFVVTAANTMMVSAIENVILADYNQNFTLTVGQELPTTNIDIKNYTFVGYILEDTVADGELVDKTITDKGAGVVAEDKPEGTLPEVPVETGTGVVAEDKLAGTLTESPIETGKGTGVVAEDKPEGALPEVPVETGKGTGVVAEDKPEGVLPEVPAETGKGTGVVAEDKPEGVLPEVPVETGTGTGVVAEDKPEGTLPEVPVETGTGTGVVAEDKPEVPVESDTGDVLDPVSKPEVNVKYTADKTLEAGKQGVITSDDTSNTLTVAIGAKDKVEIIDFVEKPIKYDADPTSDKDAGQEVSRVLGKDGFTTKTTTYTVNEQTGALSETVKTEVTPPKEELVTISTKSTVEKEPNRTREITYNLDNQTGKVTPVEGQWKDTTPPVETKPYKVTYHLENQVPSIVGEVNVDLSEADSKNPDTLMKYTLPSMYQFVRIEDPANSPYHTGADNHVVVSVEPVKFNVDNFINDIKTKSAQERYAIATGVVANTGIQRINHELTQEELNKIKAALSEAEYNQQVVTAINNERQKVGAKPLEIAPDFAAGTNQRANEQAELGYFRSGADKNGDRVPDEAHTRPNGQTYMTAFTFYPTVQIRTENAGMHLFRDIRELMSEQYLAEKQVELFMTSKDHKANMLDAGMDVAYFSVGLSDDHMYLMRTDAQAQKTDTNGSLGIFIQVFGKKRSIATRP